MELKSRVRLLSLAAISFIFVIFPAVVEAGYGDPDEAYPTHPNWQERSIITLTNACRTAPADFRDAYVGASGILLPQNYPPVAPLYWNLDLNRVARLHAVDMAVNMGLSHTSSDGTAFYDRVRAFYDKSWNMGENIAYSRFDPLSTMFQWVLDGSLDNPAPDNSEPSTQWPSGDGHRKNMMNQNYFEMGTGYAEGPMGWQDINPYWVQDFGGGGSPYDDRRVPSGTHLFLKEDVTTFMANYYDAEGNGPVSAAVNVDGAEQSLSLNLGVPDMGTYAAELPEGSGCRYYYFVFEDGEGAVWRYPEEGYLVTYGEGGCIACYSADPASVFQSPAGRNRYNGMDRVGVSYFTDRVVLHIQNDPERRHHSSRIIDMRGRVVGVWNNTGLSGLSPFQIRINLSCGVYLLESGFSDGYVLRRAIYPVR